jgi:hypothetical protein
MPYSLTEADGKFCVNGKCYDNRADALAYLQALEANVPDAHKALYAAPSPVGIFSRVKAGLTIYRDAQGRRFMFIVTSNSYKDRENEAIATKALQAYVDRAWAVEDKCLPHNPLYFWHDGDPIGDIVWADMEGPFLLEVAKERPNKTIRLTTEGHLWKSTVKAVWDAIERGTYRWGASHGFRVPDGAFENGVYKRIAKFESSVLPLDAAANPYTFAGVVNDMNKDKVLNDLLKTPGVADKFRKGARAVKQELDKRGLEHKALEQTQFKGKLDEALAIIQQAFDKIGGAVPDGFAAETLQNLVAAMAGGAAEPDGDEGMDTEYMEDDAVTADSTTPVPDEEKAQAPMLAGKQLKLIDKLIRSQEALVTDSNATRDAMVKVAKAVSPLLDLPDSVKTLTERLEAVEKRLGGAPRRASADAATVVDDKKLTEKAKEQAERFEELFPGSGIKIKSADNGAGGK